MTTSGRERLERQFEEHRAHLRRVAFRMLGSTVEVDDAVQEAWIRLSRSDAAEIQNLGGWLTTVVARICLDLLRARGARREEPLAQEASPAASDPERDALLADSIGTALLLVLETLEPAERAAFVLHDLFDVPFDDIARVVGRSEAAARQLASRARRRVRGGAPVREANPDRRRALVDAFLAASRAGDLEALLAVLAPDVLLRADEDAVRTAAANRWGGAPELARETLGARAVAETFKGRARGARPILIDGAPGAAWVVGGQPRAAFVFAVEDERIVQIDLVMDAARLGELDLEID